MNIGKLDQRVTIQELSETNNEGSLEQAWVDVDTVFAYVTSQRGGEAFEAARTNAKEIIRVQIRYRSDVTVKHRLEWLGQFYNITAVDRSMHRSGELWLTAEVQGAV